jgi:hypothetical protein
VAIPVYCNALPALLLVLHLTQVDLILALDQSRSFHLEQSCNIDLALGQGLVALEEPADAALVQHPYPFYALGAGNCLNPQQFSLEVALNFIEFLCGVGIVRVGIVDFGHAWINNKN